jgi:hypothetical protein
VRRAPPADSLASLQVSAALAVAEALILRGEPERVRAILDWAAEVGADGDKPVSTRLELARIETVWAARRGEWRAALDLFARHDREWGHLAALGTMRRMWLLRAFCEASAASPRDAHGAERWLTLVRGTGGAADLRPMFSAWPELTAFTAAHAL